MPCDVSPTRCPCLRTRPHHCPCCRGWHTRLYLLSIHLRDTYVSVFRYVPLVQASLLISSASYDCASLSVYTGPFDQREGSTCVIATSFLKKKLTSPLLLSASGSAKETIFVEILIITTTTSLVRRLFFLVLLQLEILLSSPLEEELREPLSLLQGEA